jgi:hypothetical protein
LNSGSHYNSASSQRGLTPWTVAVVDLRIVSLPDLQDARALFF